MTVKNNFNKISAVVLCLMAVGGLQVAAMNLMKLPVTNTSLASSDNTVQYQLKLVKINLGEYFGSGTIVPEGYLSSSGELSQSGLLTTTHIFQNKEIQDYLTKDKAINLSGNNTMKCRYSFGETLEYAVFVPIKYIEEMTNNGWLTIDNVGEINNNNRFNTSRLFQDITTQITGGASGNLNLSQKSVQKGDSGSMIFQKRQDGINALGIQFGFAKNSTSPMTIMWRLRKDGKSVKANIAWLKNNENKLVWDNGEYLPKNCEKIK